MTTSTKTRKTRTTETPAAVVVDFIPTPAAELSDEYLKQARLENGSALGLLRSFAAAIESGELTQTDCVNMIKAAEETAKAQGLRPLANLKWGGVQHWRAMASLSFLSGAPESVSTLYTQTKDLTAATVAPKGVKKADQMRENAKAAIRLGKTWDEFVSAVEAKAKTKSEGGADRDDSPRLTVSMVEGWSARVTEVGQRGKITPDVRSALIDLMTALDVWAVREV